MCNAIHQKLLTSLLIALCMLAFKVTAKPVQVCDDGAEWPPYIYYQRVGGLPNKEVLEGATKDLMDRMFELAKLEYSVRLLPWKRCLNEVTTGETYEMLSNAGSNDERLAAYHRSIPIYATTAGVFYSASKFSDGIVLEQASDLNKYKLCGIGGYNYEMYHRAGVKKEIDTGTQNAPATFSKVMLGRCDIFLSIIEPIFGAAAINQYQIPEGLTHNTVPGIEPTKFYLWVSKKSPRAQEILDKINKALIELQGSGEAELIYKKYLPGGTALSP